MRKRCKGFGLVEVIIVVVVVVAIGILLAWKLGGDGSDGKRKRRRSRAKRAREEERKMRCRSNLRVLGIAMVQYIDNKGDQRYYPWPGGGADFDGAEWLGELDRRKIFVFGDMLEIGESAEDEHRHIGRLCAQRGIDWLVALGYWAPLAAEAAAALDVRVDVVNSPQEAIELVKRELTAADAVLVKASRKIGLESVVKGLRNSG